jgi:GT2 family glycosyltransferase
LLLGSRVPDLLVVAAMDDPALASWQPGGPLRPEIVPVPGVAKALPLAAARNRGTERAWALGADVVIGLDVDCLAGAGLVEGYAEAVASEPGTLWSGPVTYLPPPEGDGYPLADLSVHDEPHPARPAPVEGEVRAGADPDLFWSLSFALSRSCWETIGGFCESYVGYGGEDTDFGRTAAAAGVPLAWHGSARAYHQYHPTGDPPLHHLGDILRNGRVFRERWGTWPMGGWLLAFEEAGLVRRDGDDWVRA